MQGDTIEVLLDSGADGSALPLSYGSHGVAVEAAQPLHFVDAHHVAFWDSRCAFG